MNGTGDKDAPGPAQALHQLQVHQIELERVRARYFDLYDLAPVAYCTVNEPGLIVEANVAAAALLGMARGSLVGQYFSRFIVRSEQDRFSLYRKQTLASTEPRRCEMRMVKRDGTPVWVAVQASAEKGADGVGMLRVVLSDVTDRRQAEHAARQSEASSLGVLQSSAHCVQVLDAEGNLLSMPAGHEQLGIDDIGPFLNRPWLDFWNGEDRPAAQAAIAAAAAGGAGCFVGFLRTPRGEDKWWDVLVSPMPVAHGKPARLLAVSRDVTLVRHNNMALAGAAAAAEDANRAKSDFLSSMSHELRTPLNAILGFAQLLESGTPPPSPSQQRSVDQILQAGWYLLALINQVLDLATVESGTLSLTLEPLSLGQILQECRRMIEPLAQQRGIGLAFAAPRMPRFIKADRMRMKEVLVNLLSNAIKYNRAGGLVSVTCTVVPSGRIRIGVGDAGQGLSRDEILHVFEPFVRYGRDALSEEGTGIGLVMAKRLVELMGGAIGVESTVGKGSVFWIEMDLTAEPQACEAATPAQAARSP